jgi:hypothetical protein
MSTLRDTPEEGNEPVSNNGTTKKLYSFLQNRRDKVKERKKKELKEASTQYLKYSPVSLEKRKLDLWRLREKLVYTDYIVTWMRGKNEKEILTRHEFRVIFLLRCAKYSYQDLPEVTKWSNNTIGKHYKTALIKLEWVEANEKFFESLRPRWNLIDSGVYERIKA